MTASNTTPAPDGEGKQRAIRSYVLRQGRMSDAQHRAYDTGLAQWGIAYTTALLDFACVFESNNGYVVIDFSSCCHRTMVL